jgi:hypothetical protein
VEVAARLAVLLACAAVAGALLALAAGGSRPADRVTRGAAPRPVRGALPLALAGFVVVAGGVAVTGAGAGDAAGGLAALRAVGIALLAAAGVLAVLVVRGPGRRDEVREAGSRRTPAIRPSAASAVSLAWLGAGMALASPLVMAVAVGAVLGLGVRVAART